MQLARAAEKVEGQISKGVALFFMLLVRQPTTADQQRTTVIGTTVLLAEMLHGSMWDEGEKRGK